MKESVKMTENEIQNRRGGVKCDDQKEKENDTRRKEI